MSRFYDDGDAGDYPAHWYQIDLARRVGSRPGQKALRDFVDAMLALPRRRLAYSALLTKEGEVCAVGCFAASKGIDLKPYVGELDDPELTIAVGRKAGLSKPLATELAYQNDDWDERITPEERWQRVYAWAAREIKWNLPVPVATS